MKLQKRQLFDILEKNYQRYNRPEFIADDPIAIPHQFSRLQDIEIIGFLVAILAWGQRTTIIKKGKELVTLFDHAPYDFMLNHSEHDLKSLLSFRHRTFNATDLLFFVHFFRKFYRTHDSLEELFYTGHTATNIGAGIENFYSNFISDIDFSKRTSKHVASPSKKSACKRINMFLRWMVRKDNAGVDFGLWEKIKPHQLVCPCDVHVVKVARQLGLISRKQVDWLAAEELTENLKVFDCNDPVKYDFALFGMGLNQRKEI